MEVKIMKIALIAHDKMKDQMVNFCYAYQHILRNYGLYTTGTTGKRIEEGTALSVHKLASGPLGGDQQIGAMIVTEDIDKDTLLSCINKINIHLDDQLNISMSSGMAFIDFKNYDPVNQAYKTADKMMYRIKQQWYKNNC